MSKGDQRLIPLAAVGTVVQIQAKIWQHGAQTFPKRARGDRRFGGLHELVAVDLVVRGRVDRAQPLDQVMASPEVCTGAGRASFTPLRVTRCKRATITAQPRLGAAYDGLGGCQMRPRGRDIQLTQPEIIVDPHLWMMPWPLAPFLGRLNRVTEVLRMHAQPTLSPR